MPKIVFTKVKEVVDDPPLKDIIECPVCGGPMDPDEDVLSCPRPTCGYQEEEEEELE